MTKISIITINYNDLVGLEKTFNSVDSQSNTDFEYIVIDGGSTDGSKEFLEQNSDKLAYWISEKDSGVYNAMNKGIKAAKGDYVMFLNSRDFLIDTTIIDKVIKDLDGSTAIYYGNLIYSLNGVNTQLWSPPDTLSFTYFLSDSLPHPASFIKRELFETHFYYSEHFKIVSDWEFFIYSICKMNVSYKHLDYVISNFDNSGMSSVKENLIKIEAEKQQVFETHFPLLLDDIKVLKDGNSQRFKQYQAIKSNKFKFTLLKGLMSLLLLFQPKVKMKRYITKI
ncbi:glycosyltransferase family 2 protein [Flavobacterium sp.]|jgi:glycosyltransferase involved in cell wall biosynthesis|uniref:glycosyltransferase family 2 protein n=1 Tax=Flavobacterium sp. TaxID=239 RepID=UPI0037BE3FB1